LRPISATGGFLLDAVPVYDIAQYIPHTDMLVTSPEAGRALAQVLGQHPVALMRGHGMVVVGGSIKEAVFKAYYTQLNAQLESQAIALGGDVHYLSHEEAENIAKTASATMERPWEMWRRKVMGTK
jgi:ribulose-5-phosphate 4-epimerase/fuculose-1-phosphate aldolase